MKKITVGFACDHTAPKLKNKLIEYMKYKGYTVINYGIEVNEKIDYPIKGQELAEAIAKHEVDKGIFICGTGIGISIAANKVPGIRVALCSNVYSAEYAVKHNNANGIALGAHVVTYELAKKILDVFFSSNFEGGRHERRVNLITAIEKKYCK